MNQRCHLTKKKEDMDDFNCKRMSEYKKEGKTAWANLQNNAANSTYKAQPNAWAVESKEKECILQTNAPHVT